MSNIAINLLLIDRLLFFEGVEKANLMYLDGEIMYLDGEPMHLWGVA